MASPARPTAILLVEDDDAAALRLRHHIRDSNSRLAPGDDGIDRVETVAAARERLAASSHDIVFLSLGVGGQPGLDALDALLDDSPEVPVITLTDVDDFDLGERAVERGAQDYLVKGRVDGRGLSRSVRYAVERHQRTREVARHKEQLEFFNGILQHDVRNGMNVIRMRASLLADELDGEHGDHAETVVRWSDSIVDLTDSVRAAVDSLTDDAASRSPVALAPVVETEAERVRDMAAGVAVEVDVPADLRVLADDLLGDAVGNLLTNAVEHNDRDSLTVTVSATGTDDRVELTVADDGRGVPAEERDDLFERGATGGGSGGTGFGLYFVQSMVEAYGGSVTVTESAAGGAAFVLDLPRATV